MVQHHFWIAVAKSSLVWFYHHWWMNADAKATDTKTGVIRLLKNSPGMEVDRVLLWMLGLIGPLLYPWMCPHTGGGDVIGGVGLQTLDGHLRLGGTVWSGSDGCWCHGTPPRSVWSSRSSRAEAEGPRASLVVGGRQAHHSEVLWVTAGHVFWGADLFAVLFSVSRAVPWRIAWRYRWHPCAGRWRWSGRRASEVTGGVGLLLFTLVAQSVAHQFRPPSL